MPDNGFIAGCSRCPWVATDDGETPATFRQLTALALVDAHIDAEHRRVTIPHVRQWDLAGDLAEAVA